MFVWLMFALKLPILGLYLVVRWAIKQTPEPELGGEGGVSVPSRPRPLHPRPRLPRLPRRGPHGGAAPLAPARIRSAAGHARRKRVTAIARALA